MCFVQFSMKIDNAELLFGCCSNLTCSVFIFAISEAALISFTSGCNRCLTLMQSTSSGSRTLRLVFSSMHKWVLHRKCVFSGWRYTAVGNDHASNTMHIFGYIFYWLPFAIWNLEVQEVKRQFVGLVYNGLLHLKPEACVQNGLQNPCLVVIPEKI